MATCVGHLLLQLRVCHANAHLNRIRYVGLNNWTPYRRIRGSGSEIKVTISIHLFVWIRDIRSHFSL